MEHGIVKWFDPEKNYGFIIIDGSRNEVFFHINDRNPKSKSERIPGQGDHLVFDVKKDKRGPKAKNWLFADGKI